MDHIFPFYRVISQPQHCHKKAQLSQHLAQRILHTIICFSTSTTNEMIIAERNNKRLAILS